MPPCETCEAGKSGLEPKWRKKIQGGYRVRLVMDSGAVKTILPNGNQVEITSQVADVTKPLASATEMTEHRNLVILHKTGGIVKKLSEKAVKAIRDIIKAEAGPEVILERRGGAFAFDVDVKSEDEFDAVEVANSVDELADESHSMRDIAYDSHVPESKFKSGSVTVITISLPIT